MPTPVELVFGAASAVATVVASWVLVLQYRHDKRQRLTDGAPSLFKAIGGARLSARPRDLEILPFTWEISLTQEMPQLMVIFWAINYRDREIVVTQASVTYFSIDELPAFDPIVDAHELTISARSSRQLYLRRSLTDAELRVLRARARAAHPQSAIRVRARWAQGRKGGVFEHTNPFAVRGEIAGLPLQGSVAAETPALKT